MGFIRRYRVWIIAGAVVVLAPIIGVVVWLVLPLFVDKTVVEQFPFANAAEVPANMSMGEVEEIMAGMAKVDQPMQEAMSGEGMSVKLKTGRFTDADRFHKGEGAATIYRLPDGSLLFRVESFKVTNGPDLRVILSPHPNPGSSGEVTQEGYIELGKLKGNIGEQNYPIPEGVDQSIFNSAVIYCKPFRVIFSVASLTDAAPDQS